MPQERTVTSLFPKLRKASVCGFAACLAFLGCEDRMAGTSVGTGNPTEIEVAFTGESGSVAVSGSMDVYAATQIPVPGYAPAPLLRVPVTNARHAELKASDLSAVADTLWPESSVEAGVHRFNVVVTGTDQGAILTGFAFRKDEGDFELRPEDSAAVRTGNVAAVKGALTALAPFQGTVDTNRIVSKWDYYLFIYGTGFAAKAEKGRFTIPGLPQGRYDAHVVMLPGADHPVSGIDSTSVFSLNGPIEPGQDSLSLGPEEAIIPLPNSLKTK